MPYIYTHTQMGGDIKTSIDSAIATELQRKKEQKNDDEEQLWESICAALVGRTLVWYAQHWRSRTQSPLFFSGWYGTQMGYA